MYKKLNRWASLETKLSYIHRHLTGESLRVLGMELVVKGISKSQKNLKKGKPEDSSINTFITWWKKE